uniref:Uncharacterized protein n=1 Tax=Arundo donax TaxID=35708 RepID=A0A0A9BGY0_ARUDO
MSPNRICILILVILLRSQYSMFSCGAHAFLLEIIFVSCRSDTFSFLKKIKVLLL